MLVRLLGTIEVAGAAEGWVRAGHPKQSCVLAALALNPGKLVAHETLVQRVWGASSPATAQSVLYGHIARIRVLLRDHPEASVARASSKGYRLDVPAEQIDMFAMDGFKSRAESAAAEGDFELAVGLWRAAAELWRGPALTGIDGDWADRVRQKLDAIRLNVLGGLYDAELELGRHEAVVAELSRHVMRDPLAEQLTAPLMLAYYRCGRANDALAHFITARRKTREVLGTEPGQRIAELHQRILRNDPRLHLNHAGPVPVPVPDVPLSQLPADTPVFTGRDFELAAIRSLADVDRAGPKTAVVTGMAGIGKTAMANHAAWQLSDEFSDGQLFLDLHGYTKDVARVEPHGALGRMLRNLGIAEIDIPDNVEDRAAVYRGAVARKRMVIVLDNAADEDQVRPLLPGGPHCLVIVTSRRQLLALDDTEPIPLDVLGDAEAVQLFTEVSGLPDGDAAVELAELCGHLPLAIRIAGAQFRGRSRSSVKELKSRLAAAGRQLDVLKLRGRSVKAAFDTSYATLDDDCRDLFRLLSLLPGPGFHPAAAASLVGKSVDDTQWLLDDLSDDNLVNRTAVDRYELHDLLWQYAHDRGGELDFGRKSAARARLRSWYLHSVKQAMELLTQQEMPLPIPDVADGVVLPEFPDQESAHAWVDAERSNLLTIANDAAEGESGEVAWHLADLMCGFLIARADRDTAKGLAVSGMRAADTNAHSAAQARMWLVAGQCTSSGNDYDHAISCNERALRMAREFGEHDTETMALSLLSGANWHLGNLGSAEKYATAALLRSKARNDTRQVATILNLLAMVASDRGRLQQSIEYLDAAEQLMRELKHDYLHMVLVNKAEQYRALGELTAADDYTRVGMAVFEQSGMTRFGGVHWAIRARIALDRGFTEDAEAHAQRALRHIELQDDQGSIPYTLITVAHVNALDPTTAVTAAQDALARSEALRMPSYIAQSLVLVAEAHLKHGDRGIAEDRARMALALTRRHELKWCEGLALTALSAIELTAEHFSEAESFAEQALRVHREERARRDAAGTVHLRGDIKAAASRVGAVGP